MPGTRLSQVQDIAGLRLDGFVTFDHQLEVAERLRALFEEQGASKFSLRDMVHSPHNGYRAVHIHINSPAGRLEVQLRTHGQSVWANLYETAADIVGREIRYENALDDSRQKLMERLFKLSDRHFTLDQTVSESVRVHIEAQKLAATLLPNGSVPNRIEELLEQSASTLTSAVRLRNSLNQETRALRHELLDLSS